jgi:23S rRNA (uracil1939-C5)-methyltransferase
MEIRNISLPRKRSRTRKQEKPKLIDLEIDALGAAGDGIAFGEDGSRFYVPKTLRGDKVRASVIGQKAKSFELLAPSPQRAKAPCPYFSSCGGCALQHVSDEAYRAHKYQTLSHTFSQAGVKIPEIETIWGKAHSRRRTTLRARGRKAGAILGYQMVGSNKLADIAHCLVLDEVLNDAFPVIRQLASDILNPGEEASISMTQFGNGLEVSIEVEEGVFEDRRLDFLNALGLAADKHGFTGITLNGEPALRVRKPILTFGEKEVSPPHDAFLQPTRAGEAALTKRVMDNAPKEKGGLVVDLFAGCGTFSFPLAQHFDVIAYESEVGHIRAIEEGCRNNLITTLRAVRRDLFREPLGDLELRKVSYAVVNPPRSGAKDQAKALAKSSVSRVTYVSCNPGTLARDAVELLEGGYELTSLALLDQFMYSAHSECIAVFSKSAAG